MTCTFLELYGSIVVLQLSTQKSSPHLVAQLDGVRAEIESHVLVQLSPSFRRRRFPFYTGRRRRWGGAVVQDNCETDARTQFNIPHLLSELRLEVLQNL